MKLEEAIKQKKPFATQRERASVNMVYTFNWLHGIHKEVFKSYGITIQQYNVLRILRGQHPRPISTSDIRERMLDRMSDVSRIVDRLLKKEMVTRRICKSDKRLVDVVISPVGLELLKKIDENVDFLIYMDNLTEEEAELLNNLLDKLRG